MKQHPAGSAVMPGVASTSQGQCCPGGLQDVWKALCNLLQCLTSTCSHGAGRIGDVRDVHAAGDEALPMCNANRPGILTHCRDYAYQVPRRGHDVKSVMMQGG